MNNLQPGVMELVLRAHFASIQLQAEQRRRDDAGHAVRASRLDAARSAAARLSRGVRALRSLGRRAVPALGR